MAGDWKWRCFLDIETLDCPICVEPLSMPVYQCENGHPICSACSARVRFCPSCSGPTGRIRSLTVEKILESLLVPCKHGPHGCEEMLRYNNRVVRDAHEKQACKFQSFPCFFPLCSHEGPCATFSTHLADAHGVRRTQFEFGKLNDHAVAFRMSSEERCVIIEGEKSANSNSESAADEQARVLDGLVVVHRENEDELGDWFFCTAYGVDKSVKFNLKVKRADGESESAKHTMKAFAHDSSRESVRAASGVVDRMLIPVADENKLRLFRVQVMICRHRERMRTSSQSFAELLRYLR